MNAIARLGTCIWICIFLSSLYQIFKFSLLPTCPEFNYTLISSLMWFFFSNLCHCVNEKVCSAKHCAQRIVGTSLRVAFKLLSGILRLLCGRWLCWSAYRLCNTQQFHSEKLTCINKHLQMSWPINANAEKHRKQQNKGVLSYSVQKFTKKIFFSCYINVQHVIHKRVL